MSDYIIVIVLAIIAGTLAATNLIRSKGQDLVSWAVLLLALALLVDRL